MKLLRQSNMLHFALVGVGKFGKNYLRLLQETTEVSLKTVVTRSPLLDQNVILLPSIFHTTDLEKTLSDPVIDCVVIATPSATHYAIAKAALKYKKHVLVEKPMVAALKEAADLKESTKRTEQIFMVGFQYLFNDHIRYIKKEIENDALGSLQELRIEHILSPVREDGDCFQDVAPHALSIFQFLFRPTAIIQVSGEIKKGSVKVSVRFDRGPLLSLTASWAGETKARKMTLVGKQKTIVLDETKSADKLSVIDTGHITTPHIQSQEPLKNELEHFIECINTGNKPLTDVSFGYLITKWLTLISERVTDTARK